MADRSPIRPAAGRKPDRTFCIRFNANLERDFFARRDDGSAL